ncbi:MAG: hypothetical protein JW891_01435 [Candidatus Lokiarchaeota archaeon]|nr:hypothetical protein [Candidatus Lokiarchaeota archaeon]
MVKFLDRTIINLRSKAKNKYNLEDVLDLLKQMGLIDQVNDHRWKLTRKGCGMLKYAPEFIMGEFLEKASKNTLDLAFMLAEDALTMEEKGVNPNEILKDLKQLLNAAIID